VVLYTQHVNAKILLKPKRSGPHGTIIWRILAEHLPYPNNVSIRHVAITVEGNEYHPNKNKQKLFIQSLISRESAIITCISGRDPNASTGVGNF
jgi:hypothetical protein